MFSCRGRHSQKAVVLFLQEEEKEEKQEEAEVEVEQKEMLQLDGGSLPPPVEYEGPAFPPQAVHVLPAPDQTPILGVGPLRDPLEEQLVEW